MTGTVTRRGFIGSAAGGVALATSATSELAAAPSGRGLLLLDPSLQNVARLAFEPQFNGDAAVMLQPDVVRQWRAGLGRAVADAGGARAVVRWAEAHVLAGLARECGGTASIQQLAGSAFEVRIAGELEF